MQAGGADSKAPAAAAAAGAGRAVVVRVGPVQHLAFVEGEGALPDYDGHHICLYLTEEGDLARAERGLGRRTLFAPTSLQQVFEGRMCPHPGTNSKQSKI